MTIDNIRWAGFVLRAICEGYLDLNSDAALTPTIDPPCDKEHCGQNRMYDYRYSTLMLQAMGNRWFTMHPATAEGDNWEGYGPFPQMECYAAHFNQLGKSLNLLTRARLDLPVIGVRWRTISYSGFVPLNPSASCSYQLSQSIPDLVSWTVTSTGSWQYDVPSGPCSDGLTLTATKTARLHTNASGVCGIQIIRTDTQYEVGFGESGIESMAYYALPDDIKNMITVANGGFGLMAAKDLEYTYATATPVGSTSDPCSVVDGGTTYEFPQTQEITTTCETVTGGTLEAPKPKSSAYTDLGACTLGGDAEIRLTFDTVRAIINVPLRP